MKTNETKRRIRGASETTPVDPTVQLLSMTQYPIETLFCVWHNSRNMSTISPTYLHSILDNDMIVSYELDENTSTYKMKQDAQFIVDSYPEYSALYRNSASVVTKLKVVVEEVAKLCIKCDVPASESVTMTFWIDNASVALREQMVRSKLASYWTQTSRTADLTQMDVRIDPKIAKNKEAKAIYENAVDTIRKAYADLNDLGIPTEDIRLAPECRLHGLAWMISLRSLRPIIQKRLDWIAQSSLWSPVIEQVVQQLELASPALLDALVMKPQVTIADGKVVYHKYDNENEDRYVGKDPQPVDPLWLAYKGLSGLPPHTDLNMYEEMKHRYIQLWDQEVCDVLGWDKKNPGKIGKYDRIVEMQSYR